jgi:hypothetical protein
MSLRDFDQFCFLFFTDIKALQDYSLFRPWRDFSQHDNNLLPVLCPYGTLVFGRNSEGHENYSRLVNSDTGNVPAFARNILELSRQGQYFGRKYKDSDEFKSCRDVIYFSDSYKKQI